MAEMPKTDLARAAQVIENGGMIVDPSKCALALFVTQEGETRVTSPHDTTAVVNMLRQIADKLEEKIDVAT